MNQNSTNIKEDSKEKGLPIHDDWFSYITLFTFIVIGFFSYDYYFEIMKENLIDGFDNFLIKLSLELTVGFIYVVLLTVGTLFLHIKNFIFYFLGLVIIGIGIGHVFRIVHMMLTA